MRKKNGKLYESQMKAVARYKKENYDVFNLRFSKGEKKQYTDRVANLGYSSFNEFVRKAIDEKLEREE